MNARLIFGLAGLIGGLLVSTANAQIRDNESSQNLLAVQCAVSSGLPASNYEDYCRKLAKTVGLLDATQQERVFGFLPRPVALNTDDGSGSDGGSGVTFFTPATISGGTSGSSTPGTVDNPLVDAVGNFNESLFGESGGSDSGAIIAGTNPDSGEGGSDDDGRGGVRGRGSERWNNLMTEIFGFLREKFGK